MSELLKPQVFFIENYPNKFKIFFKCIVLPITIFLISSKVFSFQGFGFLFIAFHLFWLIIFYSCYEYAKIFFNGMTEQLRNKGEKFDYYNKGVWINSLDKTIILFDQDDQRLVKYPFSHITSVGHYNLIEDKITNYTTVIKDPMLGVHVNNRQHRSPTKREYQINIGTLDKFKPLYTLKVIFPWQSSQIASDIRKLISAEHYQ